MSQNNFLKHIITRIKVDVEFLVAEGHMSRVDADIVANKLPSLAVDHFDSASAHSGLMSPPSSTISTPSSDQFPNSFKKAPPPPPVQAQKTPQVRSTWGYNEDGEVRAYTLP